VTRETRVSPPTVAMRLIMRDFGRSFPSPLQAER
jgi:hypothetical protein